MSVHVRGEGAQCRGGLAIVHRLATANGGEVALAPTPGGGLTATLELPAARRSPATPAGRA